ncbi:MAG: 50S ribosome-binding GTPase, partial [Actinomycetota bacterium]|nr:50S ribosome-binding GTPase [Actinomycetota bacterium]
MTEILERRRREKVMARLPERVEALGRALELVDGRLPAEVVEASRGVVSRAGDRLRLSPDHTIVALAGATGSGKSSLFNAIAGLDLATVGVRRPTTSTPLACVWGSAGAGALLEWLGIARRHQVMRSSVLEDAEVSELQGLVLLDLPDHDSTASSHRLEVQRLVELVDLVVWVLDPQKYADSALHDDFLRPLASHAGVMVFVLNQADQLSRPDVAACEADLRALLDGDGLGRSPVLVTSARTGLGLGRLRALLAERVLTRRSYVARVSADLAVAADALAEHTGAGEVADPD